MDSNKEKITRYNYDNDGLWEHPNGDVVKYKDHLAALAILTAEPEPCIEGEAIQFASKIGVLFLEYAKAREALCDPRDEVAKILESYASQVADKRAEELRTRVETLREYLSRLSDMENSERMRDLATEALAATDPTR